MAIWYNFQLNPIEHLNTVRVRGDMAKHIFSFCLLTLTALFLVWFWSVPTLAENSLKQPKLAEQNSSGLQRILFINSYHRGYPWSDGIQQALIDTLGLQPGREPETWEGHRVVLRVLYLNSKRNPGEEAIQEVSGVAISTIREWQPDVVATSDDNAVKYVVKPALKDFPLLPFVFSGVNWSADEYDLPPDRVAGMIEVQPLDQIIQNLSPYAHGERIAFLKGYDSSAVKEADAFEKFLDIKLNKVLVKNFTEWQKSYLQLQQECDILLLGNFVSINDWDDKKARQLIKEETRIPTGTWDAWLREYVLLTFSTVPHEQGAWMAGAIRGILSGHSPAEFGTVLNHKATVYRNMAIAKQLKIVFPMEFIRRSWAVEQALENDP